MAQTTAEQVILQLLHETGGEWVGKTKLFKAFYFAHLYYATGHPRRLTAWPIVRMPQGPGIDKSTALFRGLVEQGLLSIESTHEGPYPDNHYRLTDAGRAALQLPEDAVQAIQEAAGFCKDKTAGQLSELTHERSRSWQRAADGDTLDVELDLIPDDEFEARQIRIDALSDQLDEILGSKPA